MNFLNASCRRYCRSLTNTRFYAWVCFFLTSCFFFYKYVLDVSPGVMSNELMATFHLSGEGLGILGACYFYAYMCMQLPAGILLDRYNPRLTLSLAVLMCALGTGLFGYSPYLWVAQVGRILVGLGGAFAALGTLKMISIYFKPNQFSVLSGLMMTMAMLGAIGGEAPLAFLVNHSGWRLASLYCCIAGLVLALILFSVVSIPEKSDKTHYTLNQILKGLVKILKNPQSWFVSLYSGLAFMPISVLAGLWGVPFMMEKYHLDKTFSASAVSMTFIGFAIGSPFSGWLSEKIKRRKPIMISGTSVMLILLVCIIYLPVMPMSALYCLFVGFGFFASFFFVSFTSMKELNPNYLGATSMAFINTCNALFGAISEPLVGRLLDLRWNGAMQQGARLFTVSNYEHALCILPVGLVVALLLQLFIKESYYKINR